MKFSQLQELDPQLQKGQARCYLLISPDPFLLEQAEKLLIQKSLGTLKRLKGDRLTLQALFNELEGSSLFDSQKILIISEADKIPKPISDKLIPYLLNPNPSLTLALSMSHINRATKLYKTYEKNGIVLDIPEEKTWQKEASVLSWLQQWFHREKKTCDSQALRFLVQQVGTDRAILYHEVEKILCYVGERDSVNIQDMMALTSCLNTQDVWQLVAAILQRNPSTALRICRSLIADSSSLIGTLRVLRTQFQTCLQICSLIHAGGTHDQVTELFPYLKGKILQNKLSLSKGYGMERLKAGILAIDAAELLAKNSGLKPNFLAEQLMIKLTTALHGQKANLISAA